MDLRVFNQYLRGLFTRFNLRADFLNLRFLLIQSPNESLRRFLLLSHGRLESLRLTRISSTAPRSPLIQTRLRIVPRLKCRSSVSGKSSV